jgi:hypothetical protein
MELLADKEITSFLVSNGLSPFRLPHEYAGFRISGAEVLVNYNIGGDLDWYLVETPGEGEAIGMTEIPDWVKELCDREGYTDPQFLNGKWWAFQANDVMPTPIDEATLQKHFELISPQ